MKNAISGYVFTEDSIPADGIPEIGETIGMNDRPHSVTNITAHYDIERDKWEVVMKLAAHGKPSIESDDPPEWVVDAVEGDN